MGKLKFNLDSKKIKLSQKITVAPSSNFLWYTTYSFDQAYLL